MTSTPSQAADRTRHVELRLALSDSTNVLIRPLVREDRHLLQLGFEHLSEQSRYFRFLIRRTELSEAELDFLTAANEPDHVALGALDLSTDPPRPMGIARFVRSSAAPDEAEFAITLADRYQSRGLGTILLGVLTNLAEKTGYRAIQALVHAQNGPMLALLRHGGAELSPASSGEVRARLGVHDLPASYPANSTGKRMLQGWHAAQAAMDRVAVSEQAGSG